MLNKIQGEVEYYRGYELYYGRKGIFVRDAMKDYLATEDSISRHLKKFGYNDWDSALDWIDKQIMNQNNDGNEEQK